MNLFYREYGVQNHDKILILHGLYGCSDNWIKIGSKLGESFHVIIPDLRNHGRSPHHEIHSYKEMSQDIIELISTREINNFNLIGHSMGGKLAMSIAAYKPQLIEKIAVLDISPRKNSDSKTAPPNALFHTRLINNLCEIDINKLNNYAEADNALNQFIKEDRLRGFILKNIKKTKHGMEWKFNLQALKTNLNEIMTGFHPANFQQVHSAIPALFLKGENSDYIRETDFKLIRSAFTSAEIVTIPNAGHWLHAEQSELVLKNLLYFLKS